MPTPAQSSMPALAFFLVLAVAGQAVAAPAPLPTPDPGCICYALYSPVCDTLNNRTFGNACEAACVNATAIVPGECTDRGSRCVARCPKAFGHAPYDPVCYISRTVPRTNLTTSTQYFNPCIAACYSTPSRVLGSYKGLCNSTADAACASGVRAGSQVCALASATEYPTRCYAQQLSGQGSRTVVYSGQCRTPQALQLASRCPPQNPVYIEPIVDCFVNPCQVAPPCPNRNSTCQPRYCPGYFRNTFLQGICQAVWITPAGNIDTACTFRASPSPSRSPCPPSPLPCCPPVARAGDPPCRDCGLRGRL